MTFTKGQTVKSLIHRSGVLPISIGDTGVVRAIGVRNYGSEDYVAVTMQVSGWTLYTSFTPDEIEAS